jgi:hypothetical protein
MATGDIVSAELGEWTVFGGLDESRLDEDVWQPGYPPALDGGAGHGDPGAEVIVADGEVSVTIPRMSHFHDSYQEADNVKYLMFAPELVLPQVGTATFGVDMAVNTLAGSPLDIRFGMASLNVVDLASGQVFDIGATSSRAIALHETLAFVVGKDAAFTYLVEAPFVDFDDDFTKFRACEVALNRGSGSAEWRVDGKTIYKQEGIPIPAQVKVGFGLFTLVPIRAGASRSLQGQGLQGRWRRFRFKGATLA